MDAGIVAVKTQRRLRTDFPGFRNLFFRQGGAERRPQGGFRPNTNRPAAPAAPAKEGGAN